VRHRTKTLGFGSAVFSCPAPGRLGMTKRLHFTTKCFNTNYDSSPSCGFRHPNLSVEQFFLTYPCCRCLSALSRSINPVTNACIPLCSYESKFFFWQSIFFSWGDVEEQLCSVSPGPWKFFSFFKEKRKKGLEFCHPKPARILVLLFGRENDHIGDPVLRVIALDWDSSCAVWERER